MTIIVDSGFGHNFAYPRASVAALSVGPFEAVSFEGSDLMDSHCMPVNLNAGQHTFLVWQVGREPVEGKLVVQDHAVVQRTIALPLKP